MALFHRPNPSSGVPVYRQLMEQVQEALETGVLRPGDPLPGIRPLAEALVISPNLVARAYRELEQDRVIAVRDGTVIGRTVPRRPSHDLVRELDSARDVQERLFPQVCPPIAGLDYAGVCRPAWGVGGDYYDFIRLSSTELGIAIGDVSGKGMSAALLMATLRASLHAQTKRRATDLTDLMVSLNGLVYESSAANRYASFFYAQYDSTTRVLEYVNAGHNPPLVFRRRGRDLDVLRLEVGGPVVGLMPDCAYRQQRVTLEEEDLVVLFTDGITEAMNADGEEWDERRLAQVVRANRALPARPLVDRILSASDTFVGGVPQYDDMTLMAVRVS